jgi:hypothetical protein
MVLGLNVDMLMTVMMVLQLAAYDVMIWSPKIISLDT